MKRSAIALIPAREGSKRIPHKNIQDFLGKPLIAYSISTALESGLFSQVIVSTDSPKIASIAQSYGAKVPFFREAKLSDDHTPTLEVVQDAIDRCQISEDTPLCCLYATAPLCSPKHLIRAHKLLCQKNPPYIFAATQFSFTPFRGFHLGEGGLRLLYPEFANSRSQDLPPLYHDAGQFYFGLTQSFKESIPIFSPSSLPLILSELEAQDIDTPEDLELAKLKYKLLHA